MYDCAAKRFIEHLKIIKNASEHTLRNYAIDLKSFRNYLLNENSPDKHAAATPIALAAIDRKAIRNFLAHLHAAQKNRKTIVRKLSTLRTFFKYAFENKLIPANPAEMLDTPQIDKKIPSPLTYEQIKQLFELPDITSLLGLRDRTIMELFYSSGLRISELVALNRHDIDTRACLIKLKGKGKKERIVPVTQNAVHWLTTYLENAERYRDMDGHRAEADGEAVFLNKLGKRLSARSIDRHFEAYFKQSGLAGRATPHTIRHTIATHWLENGMDLKTIQTMLGHSCLTTTTIYTKVSNQLKQKVYHQAHPRAKLKDE